MRRLCFRRGLSAAVLLTMTLSLALPASAADPLASGGFAEVLISAQDTDVPRPPFSCPCTSGTRRAISRRWTPWTLTPRSTA